MKCALKVEQEFLRRTLKYQTASSSLYTSVTSSFQILVSTIWEYKTGASGKSTGIQVALLR